MIDNNEISFVVLDRIIDAAPESSVPAVMAPSGPTMSSLQIAVITGKNHKEVMRDIRTTLEQAEIDQRKFAQVYMAGNGQEQPCYHLPRRECDLVISGYSVKYRLAIIDRWHDLEGKQSFKQVFETPRTIGEALRLAADLSDQVAGLEMSVCEMTPKAAAMDRLSGSEGSMCVSNAAKDLSLRPADLFEWLRANRWIFRRGADWVAFQWVLDKGLLEHKTASFSRSDGSDKITSQVRVTPKGLGKLAGLVGGARP
jgi:phage antirepressor YoqD-like protein